MKDAEFRYNLKIIKGSSILDSDLIVNFFPRASEVVVASKPFSSFEECEKNLSNLLALLSATSSKVTERNQVIVSRVNPRVSTAIAVKPMQGETWDAKTVLRAYVADAEALKQSRFEYNVISAITTNVDVSNLSIVNA